MTPTPSAWSRTCSKTCQVTRLPATLKNKCTKHHLRSIKKLNKSSLIMIWQILWASLSRMTWVIILLWGRQVVRRWLINVVEGWIGVGIWWIGRGMWSIRKATLFLRGWSWMMMMRYRRRLSSVTSWWLTSKTSKCSRLWMSRRRLWTIRKLIRCLMLRAGKTCCKISWWVISRRRLMMRMRRSRSIFSPCRMWRTWLTKSLKRKCLKSESRWSSERLQVTRLWTTTHPSGSDPETRKACTPWSALRMRNSVDSPQLLIRSAV